MQIIGHIEPTVDCSEFTWWVSCDPKYKIEGISATYPEAVTEVKAAVERIKQAISAAWPMKDVVLFEYEAPDDAPPPVV